MEKELQQQPARCLKVVLYGPESTGKTTLARQLAAYYQTEWVPEYARDYLQEKWNQTGIICELSDILPIAKGQMFLENEKAAQAHRLLICDTDLLETLVYSQYYYQTVPPELQKAVAGHHYDLYLLTAIDVPWEPDDLRDQPHKREVMFGLFKSYLESYQRPFFVLQGDEKERFATATGLIDELLSQHHR